MASSSKAADAKSTLTPSITLSSHGDWISSICYFPDGQRMISGSGDRTARQWDLKVGKEIEEAREVHEGSVYAVAVSRDGRWVVTGGNHGELKACEVETGSVKTFEGHSMWINCVDISADNTLLASGATDETVRIWNLDTGKLVAGPFKSEGWMGAVRFSTDSKKLAVKVYSGECLEIWDVQSQKLDALKVGKHAGLISFMHSPVFWTNNKSIITAFNFAGGYSKTIYEFDALALETVGTPFEGHTNFVTGLALSFDGALLASASWDNTIKLWAFESRQLLASFDAHDPFRLLLSPDARQLAFAAFTKDGCKLCICDTPPEVLSQARIIARKKSTLNHLLHSDATCCPSAGHRKPPIFATPIVQRPPPTRDQQQSSSLRLGKFLRFSPRTNASRSGRTDRPRDPLDFPATLPLPSSLSAQAAPRFDQFEISSPPSPSNGTTQFLRQHLSFLAPRHSLGPPVVEVAPGRKVTRLAAVKLPEYMKVDDTRHPSSQQATASQENDSGDTDSLPDMHWCTAFLCYYSCWSHGRLRMPPRWRLERVDIPRQDGTANSSRHGGAHGRT